MLCLALAVAAPGALFAADAAVGDYFVNVAWLKANLGKVDIIDVRGDADYAVGHVPGAVNAQWGAFANMTPKQGEPGWAVVLPADKVAARLGQLGIDGSRTVVVYGMPKSWGEDGRVAWTLRGAGFPNVRMLNGGWPSWKKAGGPTTLAAARITPVKSAQLHWAPFSPTTIDSLPARAR